MTSVPVSDLLVSHRSGFWGDDEGASETDVFVIRNGDILASGGVRWPSLPRRSLRHAEVEKSKVARDDILITTSGNCGHVTHITADPIDVVCASNFLRILRFDKARVCARYVFHWMNRPDFRDAIAPFIRGTTLQNLSVSASLENVRIPLPPIETQRRIAAILDHADALRAKRRAALAEVDALTLSSFVDMFGDPANNSHSLHIAPLGEHLQFVTSGGRGWAKYYSRDGSRFIRSLDVRMNHIESTDGAFVQAPDNAEAVRTRVSAGDVLLTITGSQIGRVAAVPDSLEGSYISQHVAILRLDTNCIQPIFLSFFLSSARGGQRQIARAQYGQTKPGLNFEQIRRFQIPVPSIGAQREFVRRAAAVDALKATHRASLTHLDALFSSLQYRAFRGEL